MKIVSLLLLLMLNTNCWAAIVFPEMYEVLKVNGKSYSGNFFSAESEVPLSAGKQVILYRYNDLFDDADNDDHTKVKSAPFVLIIEGGNGQLQVNAPNILDLAQARAYALNPTLTIYDQSQQSVKHLTSSLADFEQKQYQAAVAAHVIKSDAPARPINFTPENVSQQKIAVSTKMTIEERSEKSTELNKTAKKVHALNMLNYWWQQASEQERQSFLQQHQLNKD